MVDPDYLQKRRQELGMERYDLLQTVQRWLEEQYPGQARALSFNKGVLKLVIANASVASELRMRQTELGPLLPKEEISRVQVVIGSI